MSTEKASLTYLKNNHNRKNFSVINFYKHFKFTNRIDGENEFKAAVGEARRSANKASKWKKWLEKAASNNFQLLRNEDIDAFWSDKESSRAENGAAHNFRLYIYDKVATQEKVKHDQLKRVGSEHVEQQPSPKRLASMASSSATGPSATPVVAATIATSSELSVSTQEDDNEDGEDIDIDIDIDVNSNKDPYRSPRRPSDLEQPQPLALGDEIDDFFSDAAPTTLRLPAGFELGPVPDESFMIGTNNMTARFHTCKQKALQAACSGKGLQIESQTHEIAALSHVLILKQGQYSKMMVDVLGEESLDSMYYKSRALALDHDLKFPDKAFMDISNILDELAHPEPEKRSSRLTVMSKLLAIASNEAYNVSRVIFGLAMLLSKIPNMPIANATCISETELWNCFYDPLLTAILADPKKDMMLRWVNTITPEGRRKMSRSRPDAVISLFSQSRYDDTIGHGEAKIAEPNRNTDALCRDLLRLAMFGKSTIDSNTTSMPISFQIHGFNIRFYLTELKHEAMYTMTEIAHLQVPDSLDTISGLLSKITLNTLLRLNHLVVKIKENKTSGLNTPDHMKRASLSTPELHQLLDRTKNRRRHCPLLF